MNTRPFEPRGPLALEPSAYGMILMMGPPRPQTVMREGVAIVPVQGPLMHHADPFGASYDDLLDSVGAALEAKPVAIVLNVDSPGGVVAGCFATALEIRRRADAAGIPLLAFVDGAACSAAYALACVAGRIVVSPTAQVGSIGIIDALTDATAAAAQQGLRFTVIGSGDRKTDGNPMTAPTPEAIAAAQARVDGLAEVFFAHVAAARPRLTVDELRALEARTAHGAEAVALGLADEVGTLNDLLASIASGGPAAAGQTEASMDEDEKKARAALQAIVDDEKASAKAKARAKAALAAMDDDKDEGDKKPPESKAENEPPPKDEKDDDDAKAIAARALAGVNELRAQQAAAAKAAEEHERRHLLASRPDLDETTRDLLATAPIEKVREVIAKAPRRKLEPAATAVVGATRGAGQGARADQQSPEAVAAMDRAMGLAQTTRGVKREGTVLYLGATVPAEAATK